MANWAGVSAAMPRANVSIKRTLADVRQALQDAGLTDSESWTDPAKAIRAIVNTLGEREREILDLQRQLAAQSDKQETL